MKKVAVIGNGAVGLCTAWFLNQEGFEVTVISESPQRDGKGCSYGNAGLIVPSHFTPMACPGAVVQGLKWMLNSRSPLYIKPRLNAELWRWMWLFARSATANHVQRSASILKDCNEESRELFGLFSDFGPKEFGFKRKDY